MSRSFAGIQVQREGVASSQNIEAIRAMRDINLGAQQFAMTDKALRTELNLAEIASRQNMSAVSAGLTSDLMHVITGHKEAMRGLELQKAALDSNERLGIQAYKFGLPFNERMHLQEQETVRNLAWRQKQICGRR